MPRTVHDRRVRARAGSPGSRGRPRRHQLRNHGVVVLGIARADGTYLGVPHGDAQLLAGDVLTVYRRESDLRAACDCHPRVPRGTKPAHDSACSLSFRGISPCSRGSLRFCRRHCRAAPVPRLPVVWVGLPIAQLQGIHKTYFRPDGSVLVEAVGRPDGRGPHDHRRRVRRDHGLLGLGQVDAHEHPGLPRSAHQGDVPARWAQSRRPERRDLSASAGARSGSCSRPSTSSRN